MPPTPAQTSTGAGRIRESAALRAHRLNRRPNTPSHDPHYAKPQPRRGPSRRAPRPACPAAAGFGATDKGRYPPRNRSGNQTLKQLKRTNHILLTAALLAGMLVAVPAPGSIPIFGNGTELAEAHTQTDCSYTISHYTYRRARVSGEWVSQRVPHYRRVCWNVEHTHWWRPVVTTVTSWWGCSTFVGAVAGAGAGPAGVGYAIAGCAIVTGVAAVAD